MRAFETIGSATLIAYDGEPILTTDAWINKDAYFGAWGHDYEIPPAQMAAIKSAKYHWFSHGHPDHLNIDALPMLTDGQFLLSDHYGSRIRRDLEAAGHNIRVLRDREWVQLSPAIRVYSVANQNQDSVLLVDVNGRLVINLNDSPDFGASFHIKRIAKNYREVFLLQLHGWGSADMLNLFDPDGRKLTSIEAMRRPIAPRAQRQALVHGANKIIPFSSFHRFQRTDCAWANDLVPELEDYRTGASSTGAQMLPAFVHVDCETDAITPIEPARTPRVVHTPETFGDNWSDPLEAEDKRKITDYFRAREALRDNFGFVRVVAGGSEVIVDLNPELRDVGVSFEAPRASFMTCIDYEIFDDLMISNYMRTTLHNIDSLTRSFSPYVAKYGDNGGAKSKAELTTYFGHYAMRDPVGRIVNQFVTGSEQVLRKTLRDDGPIFRAAKRLYYAAARQRS